MNEPKSFQYRFKTLDELNKKVNPEISKQQIGHQFETLIQDILENEGILIKRGFHTNDGKAEQIDGVLEVYNRIILLEAKWVNKDLAASSLFSFIGKIENKFEGTIGLFVSRNKLSENFIKAARKGRRQNVIVVDGDCVDNLINQKLSFKDYIIEAIKFLSYQNTPVYPIAMYLNKLKYENSSNLEKDIIDDAKIFISQYIYKEFKEDESLVKINENFSILEDSTKNKVYEVLIDEYQINIWIRGESVYGGDYRYYYNYTKRASYLFEEFPPSKLFLNDLTLKLFTELLPNHLEMYSNSFLIDNIKSNYKTLESNIRNDFEKNLLKNLDDNYDYYFENSITYLIEKLWNEFSPPVLGKIKEYYFEILFSNRDEKFKQKKFSIEMVESKKVTQYEIFQYIRKQIKNYYKYKSTNRFDLNKFSILKDKLDVSNKDFLERIYEINNEERII